MEIRKPVAGKTSSLNAKLPAGHPPVVPGTPKPPGHPGSEEAKQSGCPCGLSPNGCTGAHAMLKAYNGLP